MERPRAGRGEPAAVEVADPCIWMTAGALSYRLCDRDFDCERCPLDAALSKRPLYQPFAGPSAVLSSAAGTGPAGLTPPRHGAWEFPADRAYASWHVWLAPRDGARFRLGLDAFAAELLVTATEVAPAPVGERLARGEVICRVGSTFGQVPLRAPVGCEVTGANPVIPLEPARAVSAHYDDGWLVEIAPRGEAVAAELASLVAAGAMRDQARLDVRRFRRQVAMHLLVSSAGLDATMADGGEPLTDLRPLLGHARYLGLVRSLVG